MSKKPQARVLIVAADFTSARFIEKQYLRKLYDKYPQEMIDQYKLRPRFSYCVANRTERLAGYAGSEDLLIILEGSWWSSWSTPAVEEVQWRLRVLQQECPEMEIQHLRPRGEEDVKVR